MATALDNNKTASTNTNDEDFDRWRECRYCDKPLRRPRGLPCLHTVCEPCLLKHNREVQLKLDDSIRKDPHGYHFLDTPHCYTCPVCQFVFYFPFRGLTCMPINYRHIRLTYKERVAARGTTDEVWIRPEDERQLQLLEKLTPSEAFDYYRESLRRWCPTRFHNPNNDPSVRNAENESDRSGTERDSAKSPGRERHSSSDESVYIMSDEFKGAVSEEALRCTDINRMVVEHMRNLKNIKGKLRAHYNQAMLENRSSGVDLMKEEDNNMPGCRDALQIGSHHLTTGPNDFDVQSPSHIAVHPVTGNVVVIDSSGRKALLFKSGCPTPFTFKRMEYALVGCSFIKSSKRRQVFCTMGRVHDREGSMVYTVPFSEDPDDMTQDYRESILDASGFVILRKSGAYVTSLPYNNKVIIEPKPKNKRFKEVVSHRFHCIRYPTYITEGKRGEIIMSDTGNHRIGVFFGWNYEHFDFYGCLGSEYGQFYLPCGMAVDSHSRLYVCDANNYRVQAFNRSYQFESCPIRRTFLIGHNVSMDVKPLDCEVNPRDQLLVLFRGEHFSCIRIYEYQQPLVVYTEDNPVIVSDYYQGCCEQCCCVWGRLLCLGSRCCDCRCFCCLPKLRPRDYYQPLL